MPIRLLVSDIDGTLVRQDKTISEATVSAARRLTESGIAMALISARPPSGVLPLARRLGLESPLGAFNGGSVFMADGTVLRAERLPRDVGASLLATLIDAGAEPWVFADGRWFVREADTPHSDRERLSSCIEPTIVNDLGAIDAAIDKIVGVDDDHEALERAERAARDAHGEDARIVRSQPYFLDATAPRANKGDGVAAIAEALGIPLEDTAVIGDMPNDLPMFARAGHAIAMGQAPDDVKAKADRVTRSNEDDGVAHAIASLLGD